MDFQEKQEKLITEVVDVFERNDADMFETYRVLSLMKDVAREYMFDSLGDMQGQIQEIIDALEGIEGGGEGEEESEG